MGRLISRRVMFFIAGSALTAAPAFAAIPADYKGTPFNPAVAGGAGIVPSSVKAGPYAVPGRISFVNYDMGGDGVGYHTDAHYTTKDGDGYRSDRPSATMSLTAAAKPDLYYDTGTAQDGTVYPNATDQDFYVGSVHPGDWFNYTIDVKTAGTYTLSSVFSTGNGPPGGEGGDGQMELDISINGTKVTSWHMVLPDYQDKANFHNWKPYPSFAMVTLDAGVQVIKFQAPYKHLNLDWFELALVGADGGTTPAPDAGTGAAGAGGSAGAGAAGTTGTAGDGAGGSTTTGAAGATGAAGTTGTAGATGAAGSATGAAGTTGTATGAAGSTTGTAGATGAAGNTTGTAPKASSGGGCAYAISAPTRGGALAGSALVLTALLARRRRDRSKI
jgi:hypothetical protein